MEDNDDVVVWDIYFTGLVSMTIHPGFNQAGTYKPHLVELGELADLMMEERKKRCHG